MLHKIIKEYVILIAKVGVIVFVALGVGAGINFVLAEWEPPTEVPPEGNFFPALNTSGNAQIKDGGLIINSGGAELSLSSIFGTAFLGVTPPDTGDPLFNNSLVARQVEITESLNSPTLTANDITINNSLTIPTGAQDGWVLTSNAFGTAVWAQAPEGSGGTTSGSSCPSEIDLVEGPNIPLPDAIVNCRTAGKRLPTADELACFIKDGTITPSTNFLWTRTPWHGSTGSAYVTIRLSTGQVVGTTYSTSYHYRCVN